MHPSAIEAYSHDTDNQNHILQIVGLEDVHCSEREFTKSAFPESGELLYKNRVSLHRKSLLTFVLRKRNARATEPACGPSGRKGLLGPQAPRKPDVPAVFTLAKSWF